MLMVLLAYAAFILLLALPFIVAVAIGAAVVAAIGMIVRGLRDARPLLILAAGALLGVSIVAGLVAWQYLASWEVGKADLRVEQPVTPVMMTRPRTLFSFRGTHPRDALARMRDGTFDRVVGERRYLPMPKPSPGQSSYEFWGQWFEGHPSVDARCAGSGADPFTCFDFTPMVGPDRAAHFGFTDDNDAASYGTRLYYRSGADVTYLYQCTVPFRRPRHPLLSMRFEYGGGMKLAIDRLGACRTQALERLAADIR